MRFTRNDKRKVRAALDLTPLIDVVFQLLIFFMLTTTFVVHTAIPIELPEADGDPTLDAAPLTIYLSITPGGPDGEGVVEVVLGGGDPVAISEWGELIATVAQVHERDPEASATIMPDTNLSTGRMMRVLSYIRAGGIERFDIGVDTPQDAP